MQLWTLPWTRKHTYLAVDQKASESIDLETCDDKADQCHRSWYSRDELFRGFPLSWPDRSAHFQRAVGAFIGIACVGALCWTLQATADTIMPPLKMTATQRLATNATLGFEKILAISRGTSWRLQGLRAAAEYTGLDIEIPHQGTIEEGMAEAFSRIGRTPEQEPLDRGRTLAWLAHLKMLEYVVESGVTSALILEDDADWDVSLLRQTPLISAAVRNFTSVPEGADQDSAYGSNWDLLWLGHCGTFPQEGIATHLWRDPSVIPHRFYQGFGRASVDQIPEGHRVLTPAGGVVCSFAYAVSREGARQLLETLSHGVGEAFDIALSHAASDDNAKTMNSYTVNPEIFHHYRPARSEGESSEVEAINAGVPQDSPHGSRMGKTGGIFNSARCRVLWGKKCISDEWT